MVELVVEMELVMTVTTVMLLIAMTEVVILVEEIAGEKACVNGGDLENQMLTELLC